MAIVNKTQNRQLQVSRSRVGLRICLLGPVGIEIDGIPVVIASKKARALLGYLVQRGGADVARSTITGLLWGERGEEQARASLRQTLSELRAALATSGQQPINAGNESVTWAAGSAWIDVKELESAVSSEDNEALREAALLIRGEFMEGLSVDEAAFEHWLAGERERFRQLACTVHSRLMDRAEYSGDIEEALNHGLKLISLDPLQEQVHRALMRLYAAQGRNDAALAQYERCKRELMSQLGVQPEPETETLARSIRTGRRTGPANLQVQAPPAPALPDKPSIAVLPFQNMSGDPEQEYFADGIVEEITTALSHMRWLFVIARNTAFTYKGKAIDAKQVGRELGVRYLLEGSIRKSGDKIRITGQLIDTATGAHIWADRYDGNLTDVFDLQDQFTENVAGAIQPSILTAEIERSTRKWPESLVAYDYVLRAFPLVWSLNRAQTEEAQTLLEHALAIEPTYPLALSLAAWCHAQRAVYNWTDAITVERSEALSLAQRAAALSSDDPMILTILGAAHTISRDFQIAGEHLERALAIDANYAWLWNRLGWLNVYRGQPDLAIQHFERAIRLSPFDPAGFVCLFGISDAHFLKGNYDKAIEWGKRGLSRHPEANWQLRVLVPALVLANRKAEASQFFEKLIAHYPGLTTAKLRDAMPFVPDMMDRIVEGLRLAGLPE